MARSPIRLPRDRGPLLDIFSAARRGPDGRPIQFTQSQIAQIARTVRRTPEVMVKVTGGGTSSGAVAAHVSYIGRHGELEIETDEGERIRGRKEQRALLKDWHLDLSPGQYRQQRNGAKAKRPVKLVHNVFCRCRRRRRQKRCSPRPVSLRGRSFAGSTASPWSCTR